MASTDQPPMSDQLQPVEVPAEALEAARQRLDDFAFEEDLGPLAAALDAAAPFLTATRDKRIEELEGKLEAARGGLRFYSDGFSYLSEAGWRAIWRDGGAEARKALATLDTSDPGEEGGDRG